MKTNFFLTYAASILIACVLFTACGNNDDDGGGGGTVVKSTLKVDPTSLSVLAPGDTKTFTVNSNVDWTVVSGADWVTLDPASGNGKGTVTVSITENTGEPRTAIITVTAGSKTSTVAVDQNKPGETGQTLFETSNRVLSDDWTDVTFPWDPAKAIVHEIKLDEAGTLTIKTFTENTPGKPELHLFLSYAPKMSKYPDGPYPNWNGVDGFWDVFDAYEGTITERFDAGVYYSLHTLTQRLSTNLLGGYDDDKGNHYDDPEVDAWGEGGVDYKYHIKYTFSSDKGSVTLLSQNDVE
jgi:hypothetical protein